MKKVLISLLVVAAFVTGAYTTVYLIDTVKFEQEVIEKREIIGEDSIAPAVAKIYDAVVLIEIREGDSVINSGTGFFYKVEEEKGYLITNYHVVENSDTVVVVTNEEKEYEAEVVGKDIFNDLAILTVAEEAALETIVLGDSSAMAIGESVFTIGSPLGRQYMGTVTKGILSARNRKVETNLGNQRILFEVLQTDAAINPGNSGGPLVNLDGEVIGINSMKIVQETIEGMGFAIPIKSVRAIITQLEKGEEIKRPLLGVLLVDANDQAALYVNRINLLKEYQNGVVILEVGEESDAEKGGVQEGDVVLEINGEQIRNSAHFRFLLFKYEIGEEITLTLEREIDQEMEKKEITIKLETQLKQE